MTEADNSRRKDMSGNDDISLLAVGSVLLRYRRLIYVLSSVGFVIGCVLVLLAPRVYSSTAVFQPQAADRRGFSIALLASRFGGQTAGNAAEWGAPVYVELLRMRTLLEPIAVDTVIVDEKSGQRMALMDLFEIEADNDAIRVDRMLRRLQRIISRRFDSDIGTVEVTVSTRWPSVSLALVQKLVDGVNRFNVETRRSQAAEERAFAERQTQDAKLALRQAEDQLLVFVQNNRTISGSPELSFEHDRLQREVDLRQLIYTSLVQNLEEARIREVRDTPVITMMEIPTLASRPQPRRAILKVFLGGFLGGILGILTAFLSQNWYRARHSENETIRQFVTLVHESTPRFLRRFLF